MLVQRLQCAKHTRNALIVILSLQAPCRCIYSDCACELPGTCQVPPASKPAPMALPAVGRWH